MATELNITDIFAGALAIPREKATEIEAGVSLPTPRRRIPFC